MSKNPLCGGDIGMILMRGLRVWVGIDKPGPKLDRFTDVDQAIAVVSAALVGKVQQLLQAITVTFTPIRRCSELKYAARVRVPTGALAYRHAWAPRWGALVAAKTCRPRFPCSRIQTFGGV